MKTKLSTAARIAAASLALCAVLSTATPARAGGTFDVDFNLATDVGQETMLYGVAGRAGWRFDVGPVWIQPEAGGEYVAVPCCLAGLGTQIHVARVFGGARLGAADRIGGVVEPSLFGHAGYGWLAASLNGPAFDVGFALDVRLVQFFRFGVQGAYNLVTVPPSYLSEVMSPYAFQWVSFGVHAGVSF
jgi:hypothetical protein